MYFLHLSLSSLILIDSSWCCPSTIYTIDNYLTVPVISQTVTSSPAFSTMTFTNQPQTVHCSSHSQLRFVNCRFNKRILYCIVYCIQAVRGLSRLRAPGIVPCIISFSIGNSLVSSWCDHYASFLLWQCITIPFTPALLRTHSFVFFAVHETRRIFLSLFI